MSLQSTYQSRKALLVDNLETMGVTGYDENDGLTTLINAVLEIGPGPTPSFDGISLTGNKNILSAADSEYVTLEAQLTDSGSAAAVSGETVTFTVYKSSDDSVVTTLTDDTDSSGLATVSYYGQGTGDIYIQAECTFVSETYVIEDCLIYDTATSDKTSKYSTKNLNSFTFDTDHYIANRTLGTSPASTYYSPIYISDLTLPTNFEISIDVLFTSFGSNNQSGFNVSNANLQTYSGSNEASVYGIGQTQGLYYRSSGTLTKYDVSTGINTNTWYRFYMKVEGTSVVGKITKLSDSSVTLNKTATMANIQSWKKFNISIGGQSQTMHFKNVKVKAL